MLSFSVEEICDEHPIRTQSKVYCIMLPIFMFYKKANLDVK